MLERLLVEDLVAWRNSWVDERKRKKAEAGEARVFIRREVQVILQGKWLGRTGRIRIIERKRDVERVVKRKSETLPVPAVQSTKTQRKERQRVWNWPKEA